MTIVAQQQAFGAKVTRTSDYTLVNTIADEVWIVYAVVVRHWLDVCSSIGSKAFVQVPLNRGAHAARLRRVPGCLPHRSHTGCIKRKEGYLCRNSVRHSQVSPTAGS